MKTALNRLQALEADLTPRQVIMGMLEKMQACGSLDAYVTWSYTDEGLKRTEEIRENMYAAAKRRTNSKDSRVQNKAYRKAHREFHYLYDIALAPIQQQERDHYRYLFMLTTAAHLIGSFWWTYQQKDRESLRQDAQMARGIVVPLLAELHCDRLVSDTLSCKYFDGFPLIFNHYLKMRERSTAHAKQMAEHLNEAVDLLQALEPERDDWQALKLNLEAIHAMAQERSALQVEQIEQNARIALYSAEGKHNEAARMFQRMIHTGEAG